MVAAKKRPAKLRSSKRAEVGGKKAARSKRPVSKKAGHKQPTRTVAIAVLPRLTEERLAEIVAPYSAPDSLLGLWHWCNRVLLQLGRRITIGDESFWDVLKFDDKETAVTVSLVLAAHCARLGRADLFGDCDEIKFLKSSDVNGRVLAGYKITSLTDESWRRFGVLRVQYVMDRLLPLMKGREFPKTWERPFPPFPMTSVSLLRYWLDTVGNHWFDDPSDNGLEDAVRDLWNCKLTLAWLNLADRPAMANDPVNRNKAITQRDELLRWMAELLSRPTHSPRLDRKGLIELLKFNEITSRSDRQLPRFKRDWQAEEVPGTNFQSFHFRLATLRAKGIHYPSKWDLPVT